MTPTKSKNRWITLAIVASALFLICVDMTVLFTALPVLTHALAASSSSKLWIVNIYALVVAGLLPGLGTLGDRYGHKSLFIWGLAIFGVASFAAAWSPTPALLIGARALLGVGGAAMMPATLAIIRHSFSDPAERSLAIGIWAGIASGGMALGPVVGGLILEHYWWGAVFLVNVPVVVVALVATIFFVPRRAPTGTAAWDVIGSLQIMVGLIAAVFAIKTLAQQPFPPLQMLAALAVSGIAFAIYLRRQRRRPQPLIDFTLFRLPGFSPAVAAATFGTLGIVGFELVLGQHLQLVLGRTPLQAGLMILPAPLGAFLAGPLTGRLLKSLPATRVASCGLLLSASATIALLWMPLTASGLTWQQTGLLLLIGMGVGATATAASTTIMSSAPPDRSGMAASIEEVCFELGGALGVAVFGSLMTIVYALSLTLPLAVDGVPSVVYDSLDEALLVAELLPDRLGLVLQTAARTAFTQAFQAVLIGAAILWTVTAALTIRTRPR
ncbi:MAG: MFS transporter [Pseudomonadota bacterium]